MAEAVVAGMTLSQFVGSIAPGCLTKQRTLRRAIPDWPPDSFAITTAILKKTGCYDQVIRDWPPKTATSTLSDWVERVRYLGQDWRTYSNGGLTRVPEEIRDLWRYVASQGSVGLLTINGQPQHRDLVHALIELSAIADEASYGLGDPEPPTSVDFMADTALQYLRCHVATVRASTLCSPDIRGISVLPKGRTPQSGLTIRSLSHHLALTETAEVEAAWYLAEMGRDFWTSSHQPLNLLIIPHPAEISPRDFQAISPSQQQQMSAEFHPAQRLFKYVLGNAPSGAVTALALDLLTTAERAVERVDAIIFPELSLSLAQHQSLVTALGSRYFPNGTATTDRDKRDRIAQCPLLISGICGDEDPQTGLSRNYARCELPRGAPQQMLGSIKPGNPIPASLRRWKSFEQDKHHRWFLERNQIVRYGLTSQLDPNRKWWEAAAPSPRRVNFVALRSSLTMCVLICEDLARPDPVADVVRSVGPNLVVALLMDGPQLENRWSGRYASVLADDPGSSVLTVTSAGMCQLSKDPRFPNVSRKIAMWKDCRGGTREIELERDSRGVLLTLYDHDNSHLSEEEVSADGRGDGGASGLWVFGGVHQLA